MFEVKIVDNIEDNITNKNCIYVQLDYDNPIVKDKNIVYPILNLWLSKTSIDTINELKIKMPTLPNIKNCTFVNIVFYDNTYKILVLKEPIRIMENKIVIINHIDDYYFILKKNIWDKNKIDVSFKSVIEKDKMQFIYSSYNIMSYDVIDNSNNLFFKKNNIDNLYEFILDKGGNWYDN